MLNTAERMSEWEVLGSVDAEARSGVLCSADIRFGLATSQLHHAETPIE